MRGCGDGLQQPNLLGNLVRKAIKKATSVECRLFLFSYGLLHCRHRELWACAQAGWPACSDSLHASVETYAIWTVHVQWTEE